MFFTTCQIWCHIEKYFHLSWICLTTTESKITYCINRYSNKIWLFWLMKKWLNALVINIRFFLNTKLWNIWKINVRNSDVQLTFELEYYSKKHSFLSKWLILLKFSFCSTVSLFFQLLALINYSLPWNPLKCKF
jgi:hypothetical protein